MEPPGMSVPCLQPRCFPVSELPGTTAEDDSLPGRQSSFLFTLEVSRLWEGAAACAPFRVQPTERITVKVGRRDRLRPCGVTCVQCRYTEVDDCFL